MNTKNKSVLWDILIGIITAVISFIILEKLKLSMALIAISPLPLIAGFIRGKNPAENRFIKVILMNLLFLLLIMAIMNGSNSFYAIRDFLEVNKKDLFKLFKMKGKQKRLPSRMTISRLLSSIDFDKLKITILQLGIK